MIKKIISGGQTGADRAGLDAAMEMGIPHGGWIPKGKKTEKGVLPKKYKLLEMNSTSYPKRTEKNVIDSDGTVIFTHGKLTGGSKLTKTVADKHDRPCLHINLNATINFKVPAEINSWIMKNNIEILNVAGSRESKDTDIHKKVLKIIQDVYLLGMVKESMQEKG